MADVISVIKLVLYFIAMPLLLGEILGFFAKSRTLWVERYAAGYIMYFALFWGFCLPYVRRQANRGDVTQYWIWCIRGVGCMAFLIWLFLLARKQLYRTKHRKSYNISAKSIRLAVLLIGLGSVLLAVFFLLPHVQDTTAATVRLALEKKKIAARDPFTTYEIGDGVWRNFLPLFYVTGAALTSLDAAIVVQYLLPIVLLPVFYGVWSWVGRYLFFDDDNKRYLFLLLIEVFYLCMTLKPVYIGLAVFQNIWNPETVLVSVILPFVFFLSMKLSGYAAGRIAQKQPAETAGNERNRGCEWIMPALLWLCCFPAAQLCITRGFAAAAFTAFASGGANLLRIICKSRVREEDG